MKIMHLALKLIIFTTFACVYGGKFQLFKTLLKDNEDFSQNDNDSPSKEQQPVTTRTCTICINEGTNNCQGDKTDGCEFCTKIVGILTDSSQMPELVWKYVQKLKPNVKDVSQFVNRTVAIRMCTNMQMMQLVNLHEPTIGCHQIDKYGFQGRACLCNGECVYPKSGKVPIKIP